MVNLRLEREREREREREGVTRGACEDTGLKGVKLTNGVGT